MATNLRKFLLKKFPTNKYFDCPVSNEQQELMQEFCDQETKELKQQLEDAIILRQAALTDWDEMHNQLTEANALIEKLHTALYKHTEWEAEFIGENECWQHLGNPRFNDKVYDGFIAYQGIRNGAVKEYNEYKTKQTPTTTQEVK